MRKLGHLVRAAQRRLASKALILMYHRVGTCDLDPWSLCVSPERFDEHMQLLGRAWHPVSLRQLSRYRDEGRFPGQTVAVTFDDGYADNFHAALPILARYGIPATFFVTSSALDSGREFWWDELERLLLREAPLPPRLEVELAGRQRTWELGEATELTAGDRAFLNEGRPWEAPVDSRAGFFYRIWGLLQPLPEPARLSVLQQLRTNLDEPARVRSTHRAMTVEELRRLAASEHVEIGAHTVTHAALWTRPDDEQRVEVRQSKEALEKLLPSPVTSFAYPYGGYSPATVKLVSECGFQRACSTDSGSVWKRSNPFQLPRTAVGDWSPVRLMERLAEEFR